MMSIVATTHPPFKVPTNIKTRPGTRWTQRTVPAFSDGDTRMWPAAGSGYRPSAQEFYLCHLGQRWAEKDGISEPGINYYLDKLPTGYATFEINQPGGPQVYKRLFGHPSGRYYDSALRFEIHFLWLMSEMDGDCACVLCGSKMSKPPQPRLRKPRDQLDTNQILRSRKEKLDDDEGTGSDQSSSTRGIEGVGGNRPANSRSRRQVQQAGALHAVDEEGSEDIYKDAIQELARSKGSKKGIEIDLKEEGSIDWKAEREILPQYLTQIEQQHSFIPRIGELVLWCPNWPQDHHLILDPSTSHYKLYSFVQNAFHGFPCWRGGIVTSVPSNIAKNGTVDFPDILDLPNKKTSMNTAGFRVETMPDPNDNADKSLSKQYKYVPLRNIRPLSHWRLILKGISQAKLHPSILHAMTCMTSISLLEKWRFRGDWPNSSIFCKGIFLGPELITIGDTVRLQTPAQDDDQKEHTCTDIIVITSIRFNIADAQPENALAANPHLSSTTFVSFVGQAYTTDVSRAHGAPFGDGHEGDGKDDVPSIPLDEIKALFRPVGTAEYGKLYPLHSPKQKFEVSHEQVLGRLYEADAVRMWTGQRQQTGGLDNPYPSLDFDADSIVSGRRYATATDERLAEAAEGGTIQWFLADTRAQALAVATFNGVDVGKYHDVRDVDTLKQWRVQVKVAEGHNVGPELARRPPDMVSWSDVSSIGGGQRGRPVGSKVVDGKLYLAGQKIPERNSRDASKEFKSSSQMADAALASGSDDSDLDVIYTGEKPRTIEVVERTKHPPSVPVTPRWTKADIMTSVETINDVFGDDIPADEEWWDAPLPPLRGGTEESEGGDYRE